MAKNSKRRSWTPAQVRTLKTLAKKKTRAASIAKTLKRTRGRDAAKGVQSRIITRFSGLTTLRQQASRRYGQLKAPQCAGLFPFLG